MSKSGNSTIANAMASVKQKIQQDAFKGVELSRDDIKENLTREIKMAHIAMYELLNNAVAIDALTETYWLRYQELKKSQQEIFPEGKEEKNG